MTTHFRVLLGRYIDAIKLKAVLFDDGGGIDRD
jgi:hypothetical protein